MKRGALVCAAVFWLLSLPARAQSPQGYYRFPAIHGDTVIFTAEGDLWKVGVGGGVAQRLTTHPGQETNPAISPDGASVAFSAQYEGPTEVYVMPINGGLPTRLTYEGGRATVVGWTPENKVLYATLQHSTLPEVQLAAVDPHTGARTPVPLSEASDGTYDGTTGTLFFTRLPFQGSHTKRYRGGMAQQIWKLEPGARQAVSLTGDYAGTSKAPMAWQGRIYFASDRDGTMNLWSMDEDGKDLRQLTRHQGWDVASPSLSDGRIVYQLGADLRLFDIATGADVAMSITLASDLDQLREKWVAKPMDYLTTASISPDGDRVALTARGQVFVAPVKEGRLVEATRAAGVRYRHAHFMPDGKSLVALSDESGEVEWWRLPANGVGTPERLTHDGKVLRFDGVPSPDGTMIAYDDKDLVLWIYRIPDQRTIKVATSPRGGFGAFAWSPDSRWLAYTAPASNTFMTIRLYHVDDGATVPLTDDRTNSGYPAWSPDGKWIYLLSDRNLQSVVPSPWGAYQPEPFIASPTRIYAVALSPGERFPFQPADELQGEQHDSETKPSPRKGRPVREATTAAGSGPSEKPKVVVAIEAKRLQERIYEVPVPPGEYDHLTTNGERLFWLSHKTSTPSEATLMTVDVANTSPKPKHLLDDVKGYELSRDGKQIMVRKGDVIAVFDAASHEKVDLAGKKVDLSAWKLVIDPREEWHQMFVEAWRLERDYFYDRHMNGVDWRAMLKKYLPLVSRVTDRAELSDLLGQMVGELSALHIFVRGGDVREGSEHIEPSSLGAELARDDRAGGYRVAHIYRADPDYPEGLSPLARPGVDVHDGDVIEAVNGVSTLSVADPSMLLRDQVGRQVLLHVTSASGPGRDVIVTPISPRQEDDLRYSEWELTRRQRVEQMSNGQIGYVHLRAMGNRNYTEWARQFYPVYDRAGLIVDVRHNRGGNIDSWILEKLLRKAWFYWQPRIGQPYWNMQYAFRGHVVVLVDQRTASDGEAFAEGFRRLGLGKVIGMRTWGGEIWLSSSNFLVDKGIATAAETGVYGPEGEWLIEGHGVDPDIVVDDPPAATFRGEDAQLDAAVHDLQEQIRDHPVPVPLPPAYPDKSWRPERP
jgi:tricorn protease